METQHMTIIAKPANGKLTIHADIPVSGAAESYVVTIDVMPKNTSPVQSLDHLYGILADTPMPEIEDDPLPEERDEL